MRQESVCSWLGLNQDHELAIVLPQPRYKSSRASVALPGAPPAKATRSLFRAPEQMACQVASLHSHQGSRLIGEPEYGAQTKELERMAELNKIDLPSFPSSAPANATPLHRSSVNSDKLPNLRQEETLQAR